MPRKTPARVSGIKPRATRSFSDPVSVPLAPRPVQLATPTLVRTENQIVLATLMICCVVLLGAFGTSMAAGIINLSGQNNPPILFDWSQCTDGDSAAVTLDYSQIYPSAGFVAAYGTSTNNLIKFDPFTASTARCQDATKYVALKDQCYIDIYGSLGYVGSSAVASCAPTDKRCRVMDRFAYPVVSSSGAVITSSTKYAVGGWNYLCKNGCVSGACVKNPIPVCFDSDLSSTTFPYISGTSDPYVKGTTVGFMNGVSVNVQDSCFDANQLTEYYCSNGQVLSTGIACANGCASGSCVADISVKRQESTLLLSQYVLGKSNQNNLISYNFLTKKSGLTIDAVTFSIHGTSVSLGDSPVTSVTFNGRTVAVVNNQAIFSGLNLTVPASYGGKDVAVGVAINAVGNGGIKPGQYYYLQLDSVKWHDATMRVATYVPEAASAVSAPMFPVASLPIINLNSVSNRLYNGTVKLASVNVSTNGAIKINQMDFVINSSANVLVNKLVLKNNQGVTVATGSFSQSGKIADFIFNGGYAVSQASSTVLSLYGEISGSLGSAGTAAVTVGLSNGASFLWNDDNASVSGLSGVYLSNFPIDSVTITN